jgi:hypothetical protein
MTASQASKKLLSAVALAAAIALPGAAAAAPFAIQYTGTVNAGSTFSQFPPGARFRTVMVFDNGGSSAASQAWTGANLTCVYYASFNGNQAFAQNLVATPPGTATGSATTNASGVLTANFTDVSGSTGAPDMVGFNQAFTLPMRWFNNNANDVFFDNPSTFTFGDAAGGVQMAPASWTNPQPWPLACSASAYSQFLLNSTAVPTLSQWGMIILSALLALAAFVRLRKSRQR